jgi:putative ABC transport system permease protein
MKLLNVLVARIRALFNREAVIHDMEEEMRAHIELQTENNIERGMDLEDARLAAQRSFGNFARIRDLGYEVRGGGVFETLWQDVRYGTRTLLRTPGVTMAAVLAAALGISANTTIFSTAYSLILRPFNFANQDRLFVVWEQNPSAGYLRGSVAPGNFIDWSDQNQTCEQFAAIEQHYFDLSDGDQPERFPGSQVSAAFFDVLGATASMGRTFVPQDGEPDSAPVVVLKHSFWQQRFASDPNIIGRMLKLNGSSFTVIGVMPPEFNYPFHSGQLWTPLIFDQKMRNNRGSHFLEVIGLLKPNVTLAQARNDLGEISARAEQQFPATNSGRRAYVVSLTSDAVRGTATAMPALIGAAVFVLLIACANVANLLLARAASRQKEIAVRIAVGAGRWRLVRQLLTESVLLASAGGALGLLLSLWAINSLSRGIPQDFARFIPGWDHFGMNRQVLGFTLAVSFLTGILFGLAPAWQAARINLNDALKDCSKSATDSRVRHRLRAALVVTEIALSIVLLIGAGLLIRSLNGRLKADLGIRPENVLAAQVALTGDAYKEEGKRRDFFDQLLRQVKTLPDVLEAGAVSIVPISGGGDNSVTFQIVGQPPFERGRESFIQFRVATPEYFPAIGTALRKGRLFSENDDAGATPVALVNETIVRKYFGNGEAIGERLKFRDGQQPVEIIGVVADVKNDDIDEEPDPTVYVPYAQTSLRTMYTIVHSAGDPYSVASSLRSEVASLDRAVPVSELKTMPQMIDERISPKRVMAWMMGVFAGAALLLAAVGLYAVISYSVAQRRHEIGIRMALGAQSRDILRLILGHGLKLTLVGVVIGLAGAASMTQVLSAFLFGVSATDPVTFGGVTLVLGGVAVLACWIPARRMTRIDSLVALRHE